MIDESLDCAVEITVLFSEAPDLLDRVHDRRMVLVVELFTDVRIREVRQFFTQVHGHLTRKGDVFGVILALDLADLESVVAGDELDDITVSDLLPLGQDIAQCVFREVEGNRNAAQ